MCWSCRWHRGSVTENEIPDPLNISSTQPPPFEDLTQASTTVLSQMLGEVSYLTHTFIVVLFLTWNLHWLYFLSHGTLESSLSQPQGPLPDPTFILSNQLVERPIPLITSTVAGRAALAKKRKASTISKSSSKKTKASTKKTKASSNRASQVEEEGHPDNV